MSFQDDETKTDMTDFRAIYTWLVQQECDVAAIKERFLGDETLYLNCLAQMVCDPAFPVLQEHLQHQDIPAAFECAHVMKGFLSNLGLKVMYETVCDMVERLRVGNLEGTDVLMQRLEQQRAEVEHLLGNHS